jgi:parallel beta-helix repeat protein
MPGLRRKTMKPTIVRHTMRLGAALVGLIPWLTSASAAWGAPTNEVMNLAQVTACGTTLSQAGIYVLGQDLSTSADLPCISITASYVTLVLGTRTITGAGSTGTSSALISVSGQSTLSGITIVGGTLKNAYIGVSLVGVNRSVVERVQATQNSIGFLLSGGCIWNSFINNAATHNNSHGFVLNGATDNSFLNNFSNHNGATDPAADGFYLQSASENFFDFNEALGNPADGIQVSAGSTGNVLYNGTFTGNQIYDLDDDNTTCSNTWAGNTFITSHGPCIN